MGPLSASATLTRLHVPPPAAPRSGLWLPPEIHRVVADPRGAPRITAATRSTGQRLSQVEFSRAVGDCWTTLPAPHRWILQHRTLNPRAALSFEAMAESAELESIAPAALEPSALALLRTTLYGSGVAVTLLAGDQLLPGAEVLYYLPTPVDTNSQLCRGARILTCAEAADALAGLAEQGSLSLPEAALLQNAFVTLFPLQPAELGTLLDMAWSDAEYETGLSIAMERLPRFGLRAFTGDDDDAPATFRQRYASTFAALPVPERIQYAQTLTDHERLGALCFDPAPPVIAALLANPHTGLLHARLVAAHHATAAGLEHLARRFARLADPCVRRALLRNSATPDSLLRRLLQAMSPAQLFQLTTSRDRTDRARRINRELYRTAFTRATPDDRAQLILRTEGRCLAELLGLPIDQATADLLCRHPIHSVLLARALADFPGTHPHLLRHLAKQRVVRQNAGLRLKVDQRLRA